MFRSFVAGALACAFATGTAHAQPACTLTAQTPTGMIPNSESMQFCRLLLHENNSQTANAPMTVPNSLWQTFNWSHCECSDAVATGATTNPAMFYDWTYVSELTLTPITAPPVHRPFEIWVGSNCTDNVLRPQQCHQIPGAGLPDMSEIQSMGSYKPEIPIVDLLTPVPMSQKCSPQVLSATEWVISDTMGTGTYDFFLPLAIDTSTLPPPQPTSWTVTGADNAINIAWTPPQGNIASIYAFQVLCSKLDGTPAFTKPVATKLYDTPRQLCGFAQDLASPSCPTGSGCECPPGLTCVNGLWPFTPGQGPITTTPDAGVDAQPDAFVNVAPPALQPDAATPVDLSTLGSFDQLDPSFICGQATDPTATTIRVTGLQNGVPYAVIVLAIDKFGNPAGTYFTTALTPQPVTDFWQDLHDRGSGVDGGICLIAETYGDDNPLTNVLRGFRDNTLAHSAFGRAVTSAYYATLAKLGAVVHGHVVLRVIFGVLLLPLVVIALAWHALTLPGLVVILALAALVRRRRLRARVAKAVAAAAAVVVVLLAPSRAHAQRPYWQDDRAPPADLAHDDVPAAATTSLADEPLRVKWHIGIRVGPYTPQIDAQLGMNPGPYQEMYGGAMIMPMLDIDRVIWRRFGQLAIGGNLGYSQKSAHAWMICGDPTMCSPAAGANRLRSPGDTNSFHLIPLALTVAYRFTWLDDEHGVPIVPYARAGLGYYFWWMLDPNGNFSQVCSMSGCGNKAYGASIGIQASLGIAIRAERIDAAAAQSMRDSGIEHAGFYGEVSTAQVGTYSSTKLQVGATTWFAGVDFEF